MKPVLFINNFRGFKNTFLQLENVNFLVGENSTGKTSILKLIKILSHTDFWFKNDSDHFRREFGYYSEITDDEFFEIGLVSPQTKKFIWLKFVNVQGFASLTEIKQIDIFINIHILLGKRTAKYRYNKSDFCEYFKEEYLTFFKHWIKNYGLDDAEELSDSLLVRGVPIPLVLQIHFLINRHLDDKEKDKGFQLPSLVPSLAWLAPIRTEPKRTYDDYELNFSPEGTHIPYLLKKQLTARRKTKQGLKFEKILNRFGEDSGMFEKITVTQYSKSNLSPFNINIVINGKPVKIINVGYGVSQILPLIVETVLRENDTWLALQQPEIHLHPRGQAAFGDLIHKSALSDNKGFIVETHSDYTIDRFRLKLSNDYKNEDKGEITSQVVFFSRNSEGNQLTVVPILPNGAYSEEQPIEFKQFFIKEELSLLQI
jgi:AAA15 family ATPase/GTPase